MGYTTGGKILPDLIDEISAGLISSVDPVDSTSNWTNADTSWTTAVKTGLSARRALKYTKGSEIIYLAFECRNTWYTSWSNNGAKGLRVTFSSGWDSTTHTYIGSIQQTSIPYDDYSGGAPDSDLATEMLTYYMWIESNGFALMAKPEPKNTNYQQSFFLIVERNPNKLYVDGQTNFYCYNVCNIFPTFYGPQWVVVPDLQRSLMRPFVYLWPGPASSNVSTITPNFYCLTFGSFDRSYAFKSAGNGKVYYTKPVIFNDALEVAGANFSPSPIFQADIWFYWSESMGLVDGDVVAIEGQTTKYLIKSLDSPDSANRLTYAIKYVT